MNENVQNCVLGVRILKDHETETEAQMKATKSEAVSYRLEGKTAQHLPESMMLVDEEGIRRNAPEGLTLAREAGKERHSSGRVRSHHNGLKVTHTKSLDFTFNSACTRHGSTCL